MDVADAFGLPGWIEASPEDNFLYKRFGFVDHEEIRRDDELLGRKGEVLGMSMRRPARQTSLASVERRVQMNSAIYCAMLCRCSASISKVRVTAIAAHEL